MKNRKITCVLLTFTFAALFFAGCSNKAQKAADFSLTSSQVSSSSQIEESSSVSSTQSEEESSETESDIKTNEPTESQPGQVIEIQTDDKEFNKTFAANPIDKAYIKESNKAFSNIQMVQVSDKYANIWAAEVTSAYSKLAKLASEDELKKIKDEQTTWVNGKSAALKKISDGAKSAGGTMAQVDEAGALMDYYRNRAAQVYKELYSYDKNYTYEFKQ